MGGEWLYMHTAGRLLVEEDRGMSMEEGDEGW